MSKKVVKTIKSEAPPDLPQTEGVEEETLSQDLLMRLLSPLVDGIAKTFGPRCEVVLHDLSNLDQSIVKIANGHVTGRTVGGLITDHGLHFLKSKSQKDFVVNYPSRTKDGRFLKSSTVIFRDKRREPLAAVCINFDITDIINFNTAIQDIFRVQTDSERDETIETFETDVVSTLSGIVDKIIRKTGKAVSSMGRDGKIEIVRELEGQGLFMIKGAIKLVAAELNVSKFAVYSYLEKVRDKHV